MSNVDYYKVLGVDKSASQDEIKKAYRTLSMKYHPDRNPNDKSSEDKFKEINEAYSTLSNTEKRREYDNPLKFTNSFNNFDTSIFSHLFNKHPQGFNRFKDLDKIPRPGRDLKYMKDVPLKIFIMGGEINFKVDYEDVCTSCAGTGAKETIKCSACNGDGCTVVSSNMNNMIFRSTEMCRKCNGSGREKVVDCDSCKGSGKVVVKDREIKVSVSPGTRDGYIKVYEHMGGNGVNGGPHGNLFVKLNMIMPDINKLNTEQIKLLETI